MNKTTPDPGTPIFGELNKELGELPEITVHDFDSHGFRFGLTEETDEAGSAEDASAEETAHSTSPSTSQEISKGAPKSGRRRRKED